MSSTLPPTGAQSSNKALGNIRDPYRPDMFKPSIRSKFPWTDRFVEMLNCCGTKQDTVTRMLDQKELFTFEEEFKEANQQKFGLKIKVKETGSLLLDPNVTHPFVKVHIVDMHTCKYLAKQDQKKPGCYNKESVSLIDPKGTIT